jgi:cytochrome c biogenesis protein CcdA
VHIGLLAAFLGGALALLSPCSAMLLPAFFASTVNSSGRLLAHSGVFYAGLLCTLVPVGLGAASVGHVLVSHRSAVILAAGCLIICFGVLSALGMGFDLRRWLPADRAEAAARQTIGMLRPFLLGLSSGVAGFCAGPILGAVLTTTFVQPLLVAGITMAVYAAGMVLPLVVIAASLRRRPRTRVRRLRGMHLGPLHIHPVSLFTGLLLISVGTLFILTNGLVDVGELFSTGQLAAIQRVVLSADSVLADVLLVLGSAGLALAAWGVHRHRSTGGPGTGASTQPHREPQRSADQPSQRSTAITTTGPGGG